MFKAFKALAKIYKTLNVYAYLLFYPKRKMMISNTDKNNNKNSILNHHTFTNELY